MFILPNIGSMRNFHKVIFSDSTILATKPSKKEDPNYTLSISRAFSSSQPLKTKRVKVSVVEVSGRAILVKGVKWEELMWFTELSPYYKRYNDLDVYMIFKLEEIKLLSPKEVSDLQVQ